MYFAEVNIRRRFSKCSFLSACAALLLVSCPLAADITITQLANEGVIVSDGETRIIIDGMVVEPYSIYGGLPPAAASMFDQASGAFAGIDLVLASHRHHDHNQPRFACQFMQQSEEAQFVSSSQVLGLMREKCRQLVTTSPRIKEIDPQYGQPYVFQHGGADVTVFPLSHGTRKYAKIQNYGHLIRLGGVTVLHIGDAAMDPADFQRAGLEQIHLDVALIPFWFFQPGSGADVIRQFMDAPLKMAVHIPPGEMEEVRAYMSESFPKVTILESPLQEARFISDAPQPR
jgi:L-ascorbate metabolism protein UlaG (beta-lactamase superfamily)